MDQRVADIPGSQSALYLFMNTVLVSYIFQTFKYLPLFQQIYCVHLYCNIFLHSIPGILT